MYVFRFQVCRHFLAPHLATLNMDKSLFEAPAAVGSKASERQAPSPMPPPSSSEGGTAASTTPTHTSEPDTPYSTSSTTSASSGSTAVSVFIHLSRLLYNAVTKKFGAV